MTSGAAGGRDAGDPKSDSLQLQGSPPFLGAAPRLVRSPLHRGANRLGGFSTLLRLPEQQPVKNSTAKEEDRVRTFLSRDLQKELSENSSRRVSGRTASCAVSAGTLPAQRTCSQGVRSRSQSPVAAPSSRQFSPKHCEASRTQLSISSEENTRHSQGGHDNARTLCGPDLPRGPLTGVDEAVEVCGDALLQGVPHAADLAGQEALRAVRGQLAVAENVQKIKDTSKES